jgi:hypothetical protein
MNRVDKATFVLSVFAFVVGIFVFLYSNFETQNEFKDVTSNQTYRIFQLEERLEILEKKN